MSNDFFIQNRPIAPLSQSGGKQKQKVNNGQYTQNFQELLDQQISQGKELKFSKHAQQRLNMRNIKLDENILNKLNFAVDKAAQKGAKDSLVLMQDLAFVVSVKNKTVITAMDGASVKDNVFTNIDSAVII